jgi:cytochrome c oxidase subunit 1
MRDTYDFMLHDTYYIIAPQHVSFVVALVFGIFCAFYYAYPRLFRRPLNKLLSYIHFWVTFVGAYILFWPFTFTGYEGLAGMPRRYLDFSNGVMLFEPRYFGRGPYMELMALCLLIAQFLFVFNFISSLRKGRKVV